MAFGAVIELGTDFDPVEPVRLPPPVWWRRGVALAGYAALALLLLGPAAPPAVNLLVPVVVMPAGGSITYQLSGDTLYAAWLAYHGPVAGAAQPEPSQATLDAYALADGRLRWRVLLPVNPDDLLIRPVGTDTVVVSALQPWATGDRTVAFEASTGRLLWDSRLPVLPAVPVGETVTLGAYLSADGTPGASPYQSAATGTSPPELLLQGVNVRTGAPTWARRVAAGSYTALPAAATLSTPAADPYAVVIAPGGDATSVDLTSGAVSGTARVHVGPTRTLRGDEYGPSLVVTGPWLLVGYLGTGGPTLAAYRAATLRPAWVGRVRSLDVVTTQCGQLTCLTDEEGTRAVDLATGREGWSTSAWQPVRMLGRWLYALPQGNRHGSGGLLAPGSGTPLLTLAGWAPVPGPAAGPYLLHSTQPADQLVAAPAASWLGVLRATGGVPRVQPLGPMANLPVAGCVAVPGFLACDTAVTEVCPPPPRTGACTQDSRLWIWRYRG